MKEERNGEEKEPRYLYEGKGKKRREQEDKLLKREKEGIKHRKTTKTPRPWVRKVPGNVA